MATRDIDPDQQLVPSLLDRLIDGQPDTEREPAKRRNQLLRELKASVQRDLENLLNTRWRCVSWPPELDELETSLVNYGIPDFTGKRFATAQERQTLRRILEQVIRRFEPRFERLAIDLLENKDPTDRRLNFRIDALLKAEPAPEPVVFDTRLETSTGNFDVLGAT